MRATYKLDLDLKEFILISINTKNFIKNNVFYNSVEVKFVWQISYSPANGASQGNYFLPKN